MLFKNQHLTSLQELKDSAIDLMNNIPNPIVLTDPDSTIAYVNPALEDLIGFSAPKLLGVKAPYPYWPERMVEQYLIDMAVTRTGRHKYEYLLQKKNGVPIWVLISSVPVIQNGNVKYILASWTDITLKRISREKIRRSEKRFRILAEGSKDRVYSIRLKPKFEVDYISPSISTITGYSLSELYLNSEIALKLFCENGKQDIQDTGETPSLSGGRVAFQWTRKDGRTIWIEEQSYPIRNELGEVVVIEGVIRDITEHKQAEDALVESEVFNSTILNNAPNPIYVMEPDTSIKYINTAFEKLTCFSSQEITGLKAPYPWWLPDEDNLNMVNLHRDMKSGFSQEERCLQKKTGDIFWVQTNFKLLTIDGTAKYFLNNWVDVTERKKTELALEASEKKYRSLVNNLKLGVFRSTPNDKGRYLEVNNAMEDLTGYSRRELLQIDVCSIYANSEERSDFVRYIAIAPGKITREMVFKNKNGKKFDVACTASAVKDENDSVLYIDGILEDITERKAAQARALETESLKQLNKAKSELLANVSHELRTPLASIKGFIETLIEPDVSWSKKEQVDFLKSANKEADHLASLIRDLLDMSRLDSGKMVLEKRNTTVSELFQTINELLSQITKKHVLKIKLQNDLPSLLMDKLKIAQVVTNLVENATKFSPEGSPIAVNVKTKAGNLEVSVQDWGEGIAPEALDNLFNRFYQAKRVVSGKTRGSGLGLAICKGIVEAHGGKIGVNSCLGHGSTFFFNIPLV